MNIDKRILNFLVIIVLTTITFWWTFFIFHLPFEWSIVLVVICMRIIGSITIYKDYSLSWSKVTQKTFLIKSIVYIVVFLAYVPIFYQQVELYFLASELFLYIFSINFIMYAYYYLINRSKVEKTKKVIIYGAGKAGLKLKEEFRDSQYRVQFFCDDDKNLQGRSVDSIEIVSQEKLKEKLNSHNYNLLVIAMPSVNRKRINDIYKSLNSYFNEIQILPSLNDILRDKDFLTQLKDISLEDLLARHPQDLDKKKTSLFIKDKVILITGAGGSIGSELVRQSIFFKAKKIILLDHSEFNLYQIEQEVNSKNIVPVLQSVVNVDDLENTFKSFTPDIVLHAAAYKHVPLVESNIGEAIKNNIIGTKNIIDLSIKYGVKKVVLVSTDKAVRPTNVMGATKRICELYAQNAVSLENAVSLKNAVSSENANQQGTEIVAVRFGNVLGSSGSVIPKFKAQIEKG
ncbi:MAG: polysaccharide biosynthesis protein, partial [Campylobacterota bacterium]|nr:polysaccharide biosynthesis protein [Campylobacterota bacterium]